MQNARSYGLGQMPAVEPSIASLMFGVPGPSIALQATFCVCYNTAARIDHVGISLFSLILALFQSLQSSGMDAPVQSLCDASLQAFTVMTRELDRLMSTFTLNC